MAVYRTRMRITMRRMRTRMSGRVLQTTKEIFNRPTTTGTCSQCCAEGNEPQQQHRNGGKLKNNIGGQGLVGRSGDSKKSGSRTEG